MSSDASANAACCVNINLETRPCLIWLKGEYFNVKTGLIHDQVLLTSGHLYRKNHPLFRASFLAITTVRQHWSSDHCECLKPRLKGPQPTFPALCEAMEVPLERQAFTLSSSLTPAATRSVVRRKSARLSSRRCLGANLSLMTVKNSFGGSTQNQSPHSQLERVDDNGGSEKCAYSIFVAPEVTWFKAHRCRSSLRSLWESSWSAASSPCPQD